MGAKNIVLLLQNRRDLPLEGKLTHAIGDV